MTWKIEFISKKEYDNWHSGFDSSKDLERYKIVNLPNNYTRRKVVTWFHKNFPSFFVDNITIIPDFQK